MYISEVESPFSSESPPLEEGADEIVEVVDNAVELLGKQPKDSSTQSPSCRSRRGIRAYGSDALTCSPTRI